MANLITGKTIFLLLLLVSVIFEVIADVLFKKWAISNKIAILIIGFGLYSIGTVFWAFSLKYEYFSKAVPVFIMLNLIFLSLIGVYYFHERLSTLNIMGVLLALISIILIEI